MTMVDDDLSVFLSDFKSEISGILKELLTDELGTVSYSHESVVTEESSKNFLNDLHSSLLDLQKKCIFLSLVFLDNPNPPVKDIKISCHSLRDSICFLCSVVSKCPKSIGRTLLSTWRLYLRNICQNLTDFVSSLSTSVTAKDSSQVKTSIGKLCHDVERVSKLSKTNRQAACISVQSSLALVEDALEELVADDFPVRSSTELSEDVSNMTDLFERLSGGGGATSMLPAMASSSMDPDDGTNSQRGGISALADEFVNLESILSDGELRQLIQIAVGLVKTVRACLKKASSQLQQQQGDSDANRMTNERIDEIVDCCNKMSPTCDEFILALYPPRRARLLESEAKDLSAAMRKLLITISGETNPSIPSATKVEEGSQSEQVQVEQQQSNSAVEQQKDKQLEILEKAVEHNTTKLINFLKATIH